MSAVHLDTSSHSGFQATPACHPTKTLPRGRTVQVHAYTAAGRTWLRTGRHSVGSSSRTSPVYTGQSVIRSISGNNGANILQAMPLSMHEGVPVRLPRRLQVDLTHLKLPRHPQHYIHLSSSVLAPSQT